MRQAQSNRRGRGRSRKAQNPLTKNYESNGPDVKIRGTAAHICEKYNSLARDALASSDIVRHENYLQHAEHYNRIIMAAQQNNAQAEDSQSQAENGQDAQATQEGDGAREANKNNGARKRNNNRRRRPDDRGQRNQNARNGKKDKDEIAASADDKKQSKANGHDETVQPLEAAPKDVDVAPIESNADDAAA